MTEPADMSRDLETALAEHRDAVAALVAASERCGDRWLSPRSAGKWSPSQIVEHVSRALEESGCVAAGAPSKFPTLPAFVRPLLRGLFFNRVLRKRAFPKARTSRAMNPAAGPETIALGRARLEGAAAAFEQACRAASSPSLDSSIFGRVSVPDYALFQACHTRHHLRQMPS